MELVDLAHPGETPYNWLAHRQLDTAISAAAREHATGRLIDIGCGLKPYAAVFRPLVSEHVGVDHPASPHADTFDVLAGAYDIPLDDASFDTALMSEVLEHLERPGQGLAEAHRLLAPGGKLILTTPLFWVLHEEPRDFFRYTPHSLRYLLAQAGFVDISVTPIAGQWSTVALMGSYAVRRSPLARRLPRVAEVVSRAAQRGAIRLDRRWFEPWMSWNHLAIATKG